MLGDMSPFARRTAFVGSGAALLFAILLVKYRRTTSLSGVTSTMRLCTRVGDQRVAVRQAAGACCEIDRLGDRWIPAAPQQTRRGAPQTV